MMEISPKAEAASCRLHKPMCVPCCSRAAPCTKEARRFHPVPAERFAGASRGGDVQAQNRAGEGGLTVPLETTYARTYKLNAHELPWHTWERNLIFVRIDARAQHGALADSFAISSSRDCAGPGVVQQHYLLTRGKTAGLQTSGSMKVMKCFFSSSSSSLLHLSLLLSHQPADSSLTSVRQVNYASAALSDWKSSPVTSMVMNMNTCKNSSGTSAAPALAAFSPLLAPALKTRTFVFYLSSFPPF